MPRSVFAVRTFPLAFCVLIAAPLSARAQVFIVEPEHISRQYSELQPTDIKFSAEPITKLDREELIRFLEAEQGFAMRPLPVGILTLRANGGMEPSGDKYIDELHTKGMAAKPGDRLIVTNIRFEDNRIVLDFNNGPYHKHRYLRHISIGMDPNMDAPLAMDDPAPTGTRINLVFPSHIPDITGEQVEALLKPMVDFGIKSQAEAYAESLPPFLRKAVEEHRVLVGMDKDMVLASKGEPIHKDREQVNGRNVEIWMYGEAPQPVEFIRFNGSFVIRVEIAKVGEPLQIQTANEMQGYWDNQPVVAADQHQVQLGDRSAQSIANESASTPPTLRNAGEKLPNDDNKNIGGMAPVNWPPDLQRPGDPAYKPPASGTGSQSGSQSSSTPASPNKTQPSTAAQTTPGSAQQQGTAPSSSSSKQPAAAATPPPPNTPQRFVSPSQLQ